MQFQSRPKRKPLLDLELEMQGDGDVEEASAPPQKRSSKFRQEESGGSASSKQPKKTKEFAWMDSDDDESDSKVAAKSDIKAVKAVTTASETKKRKRNGSRSSERSGSPSDASDDPPLPSSVAEVNSFSQMVRMTEKLMPRVKCMGCTELVQCLDAAARVKFFDSDFLQDAIIPRVLNQLGSSRRKSPFATEELVTILFSLANLNCFHKTLFGRIVKELADKRHQELNGQDRGRLLTAFKLAKYDCDEDKDFYAWLISTEKAERYADLCAEQRMIVGNSQNGMHAPEGYLRSFMVGTTSNGVEVRRPTGLTS